MTESQIKYFLAAAEEGSITRAANRLFVSQPAVSKSVTAMEQELGFQIFVRNGNSITLTHAGTLLYEFLSKAQEEYKQVLKTIKQDIGDSRTKVKIGCSTSWNPDIFLDKIKKCITMSFPSAELEVFGITQGDLMGVLRSRMADIVLTVVPYDTSRSEIKIQRITDSGCGILYSKKHFRNISSVEDFKQTNFLIYDSSAQPHFEHLIQEIGGISFSPKTKNCGNADNAIFEMSQGNGIMFMTDWLSVIHSDLFSFLPLDTSLPVYAMYLQENDNANIGKIVRELENAF